MLRGILAVPSPTSDAAANTTNASISESFVGSADVEQPTAASTNRNSELIRPIDDVLNVNVFLNATPSRYFGAILCSTSSGYRR